MAKKPWIIVDVEADGEYPGDFSMVCFGAVLLDLKLDKTYYGRTKPISDKWKPDALAVSGISREEHLSFPSPEDTMNDFVRWFKEVAPEGATFVADNPAFDFAWMNWYLHKYTGSNPFGYSARRISDLYCGFVNDMHAKWKWMRTTTHSHNPVDDAMGNAEALIKMQEKGLNLKIK